MQRKKFRFLKLNYKRTQITSCKESQTLNISQGFKNWYTVTTQLCHEEIIKSMKTFKAVLFIL